jgi:hypothetical protein
MNLRQKQRAESKWCSLPARRGPWTLMRLEMISTVQSEKWPVCRLELLHDERGQMTETATGAGCLDAAFNAVSQACAVSAPVKGMDVDYCCSEAGALPLVTVEIEVVIGGGTWRGCARTGDLLLSAVCAYLDGIVQAIDHGACVVCAPPY